MSDSTSVSQQSPQVNHTSDPDRVEVIPTRTTQLSKLTTGQLIYCKGRVRMEWSHALGYDRIYARTCKQLENRIVAIIRAREIDGGVA